MDIIINKSNIYNTEIKAYNDFIYNNSVLKNEFWDEEIVDEILKYLEDDSDILDIGANIGLITLGILKKAKDQNKQFKNIHCFECDPKSISLLIPNTSPFENVKIYPFALSNKQELCNITTLNQNMGCNYIYSSKDEKITNNYDYSKLFYTDAHIKNNNIHIVGVPLDSIKYHFESKISIIKIDVEGYEINVLEGAQKLIQEHRPIIICEVFEKINFDKLLEFFEKVDYKSYKRIKNKLYKNEDYIFFPN
jgi:FkbM family methyltransferase